MSAAMELAQKMAQRYSEAGRDVLLGADEAGRPMVTVKFAAAVERVEVHQALFRQGQMRPCPACCGHMHKCGACGACSGRGVVEVHA